MSEVSSPKHARRGRRRGRAFVVFCAVAAAQISLLFALGRIEGRAPTPAPDDRPPFEVILYDPPPPRTQPPPAPETGGGAPAAPSRVHTPPSPPPDQPRETPSPPVQAPEPSLVVGAAPAPSAEPGFGQGGRGDGAGAGVGSGSGPGSGSAGPRLITGPTVGQIRANHPRAARTRYGRVELSCVIRLDDRLEDCRVLSESPSGVGFGEAGLRVAEYFRFQAPTENGRPVSGQRVRMGVDFGNPPR